MDQQRNDRLGRMERRPFEQRRKILRTIHAANTYTNRDPKRYTEDCSNTEAAPNSGVAAVTIHEKKHTAQFGSFSLQLVLCSAAVCSMITGTLLAFFHPEAPAKASQRVLTFADRVAYQRAIEDVYWRHRIWPKERPDPKPSLDAVMSQAQLEKKVADYLRKSQALEDYWQRPIPTGQLQGEMDRMAQHTKQPEVLRELFQALGNDPFVIAECLVRPVLSERLFTSALAYRDVSWAVSQRTRSQKPDRPFSGYTLPKIQTGLKPEGTCFDAWGATSTTNAPDARVGHTAVWTGSEMIVWGGYGDSKFLFEYWWKVQPDDRYVDVDRLHQRTCATGLSHGSVERQ